MKKKRIICDLDGVVVNLHTPWLQHYRDTWNDTLTEEDIHSYELVEVVKKECGAKIYDFLNIPKMFRGLAPYKGALEALQSFHKDGFDVAILTAPSRSEESASDKIAWVRHHMPWLPRRHIMTGHLKHWVKGDFFIDDSPDNIRSYREEWPDAQILTIAWPFNEKVKHLTSLRAESFKDPEGAWRQIVERVRGVAK